MRKKILFLFVITMFIQLLFSSNVKKTEVKTFKDFISGKLNGTAVSNMEKLIPGIKTENFPVPEEEYLLSADISVEGNIYIGTGHNGKIYKIGKDKKVKNIFTAKEPDIYAVLVAKDKSVYFGTSPRGKVFKIDSKGKIKEFFDPSEKYIWNLKEDKAGNILCAVGGSGAVYRIDVQGNPKKILNANDTHILSLYVTDGNRILAGSSPKGILYGVKNGKTSILDDTPYSEVRGICGDEKGNIYYVSSNSAEKNSSSDKSKKGLVLSVNKKKSKTLKSKGNIYCLSPDGSVEILWISDRLKPGSIHSIIYDKLNKSVLAGSSTGKLYRVKSLTDYSLIYEGGSNNLFKLIKREKDFFMIFDNTPRLVKGSYYGKDSGTYFSDVFNLGYYSRMGKLYWSPGNRNYNGITFFVRAGNSESPGKSWTDWSAPFEGKGGKDIGINGYGYAQIKIALNTSGLNKSPSVQDFKFYYAQLNLKPVIIASLVKSIAENKKEKPDAKENMNPKGKIRISWLSIDPNKDKLEFSLFMRKEGGKKWIVLAKNITGKTFNFKKALYEDGLYRIKIVADDSLSNPPENYKTESFISDFFKIDSTPPVLSSYKNVGGVISFKVSDEVSVISDVFYSTDGKIWKPVFPKDKIADSFTENYMMKSGKISGLKGIIFFKVVDESMNFRIYQKEL